MHDLIEVAPVPPVPLHDLLVYRVPEPLRPRIQPGIRVRMPLGRQIRTGVVAGFTGSLPAGERGIEKPVRVTRLHPPTVKAVTQAVPKRQRIETDPPVEPAVRAAHRRYRMRLESGSDPRNASPRQNGSSLHWPEWF